MAAATSRVRLALADTSLFIALEQERPLVGTPPEWVAVLVITIAELRLGVLAATDGSTRARRLETLTRAGALDPLPVDRSVAAACTRACRGWTYCESDLAPRMAVVG